MICQVMQLKTKVCSVLICLLPNSQQAAVLGFGCKLVQLQTPSLNHYVCLKKKNLLCQTGGFIRAHMLPGQKESRRQVKRD